jgi:hypothetical protein
MKTKKYVKPYGQSGFGFRENSQAATITWIIILATRIAGGISLQNIIEIMKLYGMKGNKQIVINTIGTLKRVKALNHQSELIEWKGGYVILDGQVVWIHGRKSTK